MTRPRFLPRLGLRARITIAFAVGALLLSALLAATTWGFTHQNQLDQRSTSATTLAVANAENMTEGIESASPDLEELLQAQARPTGAHPILLYDGDWYPVDPTFGQDSLPPELIEVVEEGDDARMRYTYRDEVYLAVGVRLDTEVDEPLLQVTAHGDDRSTVARGGEDRSARLREPRYQADVGSAGSHDHG